MDEPIEETYFNWLYFKVASVPIPTPSLSYLTLFRDLHSTEFVWLLSGDDNRAQDGLDLRREFDHEIQMDDDPDWMFVGCSVLEMLIAFSRRAEFFTNMDARDWFWIMIKNLGLHICNDARINNTQTIDGVLQRFVWRTYSRNGHGGLFPLSSSKSDQRTVEIWYQFSEYLVDQELI